MKEGKDRQKGKERGNEIIEKKREGRLTAGIKNKDKR